MWSCINNEKELEFCHWYLSNSWDINKGLNETEVNCIKLKSRLRPVKSNANTFPNITTKTLDVCRVFKVNTLMPGGKEKVIRT